MSGCPIIGDVRFEQCFHYLSLYDKLCKNAVYLNCYNHLFFMISAGPKFRAQQGQLVSIPGCLGLQQEHFKAGGWNNLLM